MTPSTQDVHRAIQTILSDKKKYATSLNYAVNYCRFALCMNGKELGVQCLYILNNITGWRNLKAKEVRATLREFAKYNA